MLRFVTIFFAILMVGVSAGLYHVKYSFDRMERQAQALQSEIAAEREAIRILEAEWSVLNRPNRLQNLADRYLDLEPVEPTQIVSFSDLPAKVEMQDKVAADPGTRPQNAPPLINKVSAGTEGVTQP